MGENMNQTTTRGSDFITLTPLRPKQKKMKIAEFNEFLMTVENGTYVFELGWFQNDWWKFLTVARNQPSISDAIRVTKKKWINRDTKSREVERNGGYSTAITSYSDPKYPVPPNVFLRKLEVYDGDATNASNLVAERVFNSHNQFRNWDARLLDQMFKSGVSR